MTAEKSSPFDIGEHVILQSQGAYVNNLRSGWKPGRLCLTQKSLSFWQLSRVLWEAYIEDIKIVEVENKTLGFGRKQVLCLTYRKSCRKAAKVWFAVADIEAWRHQIFDACWLKISKNTTPRINERYMDIVADKDYVEVIVELSETERQDVFVHVYDNMLVIEHHNSHYFQKVFLPCDVETSDYETGYKNGFFRIVLKRLVPVN